MDFDDTITPDILGIALGLGEEIAVDEEANRMSQTNDGVLGPLVKELVPIVKVDNAPQKLVDLTDMNNWLVPMSKRLRSPFIEKWKRVALGLKGPNTPLLTHEEKRAYLSADPNHDTDGTEIAKEMVSKLKKLREANIKVKLIKMAEKIVERRYLYDKNQNDGEKRI